MTIGRYAFPSDVIKRVARFHKVTVDELKSRSRKLNVIRAKHHAIWILASSGKRTLAGIGRIFRLDHTTIRHAVVTMCAKRNRICVTEWCTYHPDRCAEELARKRQVQVVPAFLHLRKSSAGVRAAQ